MNGWLFHVKTKNDGGQEDGALRALLLALYFRWAEDPADGAQIIVDFSYKLETDLALPSNGNYPSRGILLKVAIIGHSNLGLILIAVGTREENTTIRALLRPMPHNNVVKGGHLIDGGRRTGMK